MLQIVRELISIIIKNIFSLKANLFIDKFNLKQS